jgi:predicted nuclease of predicted toxin-antitoxin system
MRFITDENVPIDIEAFLEDRGHEVIESRVVCLPAAEDHVIALVGNRDDAILITWNRRDFKRITARRPPKDAPRKLRRLGVITFFKVKESRGLQRLQQIFQTIEAEFDYLRSQRDTRLFVVVATNWFKFER